MKLKSILGMFLSLSLIMIIALSSYAAPIVSVDIVRGKISINGNIPSAPEKAVAVQIIPADCDIESMSDISDVIANVVYWAQTETDENGDYSLADIKLLKSGDMIVRVMPQAIDAVIESSAFTAYSDGEIANAWKIFEGEMTKAEIESAMDSAFAILGITDDISASKAPLAKMIASDGDFGALSDASLLQAKQFVADSLLLISKQAALLAKIASAKHASEIYNIVSSDANAGLLGVDIYSARYKALGNTTSIDTALAGKTFADTESFALRFAELLAKAENPSANNGNNKYPTGGNGSSGVGGGGGNLGGAAAPLPQNPAPETASAVFDDIDTVPWAIEAIEYLYKMGLVSGRSAENFVPNDNITREELVKLVVSALGITAGNTSLSFGDADVGAWYYPYLCAAVENGLISGHSDEYFGIGEYISREDTAVILDRALSYLNIAKSADALSFDDENSFASYARDAIYNLAGKGIINGDGTGSFNPKGNATRAEAACMLYRFLNTK